MSAFAAEQWRRGDPVFRFVQTRAPQPPAASKSDRLPQIKTWFDDEPTALFTALASKREDGDAAGMIEAAQSFIDDPERREWGGARFRGSRNDLVHWLTELDDFLVSRHDRPKISDLEEKFLEIVRSDPTLFRDGRVLSDVFTQQLRAEWRDLGDSVIAAALWFDVRAAAQATMMRAIRVIGMLNDAIERGWRLPGDPAGSSKLADVLARERVLTVLLDGLVLLPSSLFPLPSSSDQPARLGRARVLAGAVPGATNGSLADANSQRASVLEAQQELTRALRNYHGDVQPTVRTLEAALTPSSRSVLEDLGIAHAALITDAINLVATHLSEMPSDVLPSAEASWSAALRILGYDPHEVVTRVNPFGDWNARNLTRAPVVGDLLVVEQELIRYEAREIADIENILAKESKKHIHRFKELLEQEVTTVTEHEEDRTHDNQTTDRQELEREASRQSQTQAKIEGGATFSASYGPVKVGANLDASYASSVNESNRQASKFSHEVVDRASESVRQRTLETRRTLTRQETLDRSEHAFDNQSSTSVVGIYQWVEKVYEAATFNYGIRMMLDVTVPEPGAYWQYSKTLATAAAVDAKPPPALTVTDPTTGQERDLLATDIGEVVSIAELAKTYRVGGLKPPPPRFVSAGISLRNETSPPDSTRGSQIQSLATKSGDIKLPANYQPRWSAVTANVAITPKWDYQIKDGGTIQTLTALVGPALPARRDMVWDNEVVSQNTIAVGPLNDIITPGGANIFNRSFAGSGLDHTNPIDSSTGEAGSKGSIPVVISVIGSPQYAATATVTAELSDDGYRAWQLDQFEAVVTQWETWNQEFEAAVRAARNAAAASDGPASGVLNPALGSEAIAEEMRRLFLEMLEVPLVGVGGSLDPADTSDLTKPKPPVLHPGKAAVAGRTIQFVEQAFEWPQMTYFLYPYYWKAEVDWPGATQLTHPDPAFADFLRAGCARVVVPVRPGFEAAVSYHLGVWPRLPWQAGTPPIVDLDPYISIAEEIKSAQTSLARPVRIDEPWLVHLPTTLVKLKDDDKLPVFREPTDPGEEAPLF